MASILPSAPDGADPILRPGDTCWRIARADRFALIVDVAPYFAALRSAMLRACESIALVGWDFDFRVDLAPDEPDDGAPGRLGSLLEFLVRRNPDLSVHILKWDTSFLFTLKDQLYPTFVLDFEAMRRIELRFDGAHPAGAAHHQKIAVIDERLAFCGGIDISNHRWDTREHRPDHPRRRRPGGGSFTPWHDAIVAVDGEAARALAAVVCDRWKRATGKDLTLSNGPKPIWPHGVEPQLTDVDVAIARTMPAYDGQPAVHEIEHLYVAAIRAARDCIYLESQFFASRVICDAIAERLGEPDGPEVVVVNPDKMPSLLQQETVGAERDMSLARVQQADRESRFRIYHPVNAAETPIYVHAKVLIVDDRLIRVGSSNVDNRSIGFDTECDLALEAGTDAERRAILSFRDGLVGEHLGVEIETLRRTLAETGSLGGAIDRLRSAHGRSLRPIGEREVNAVERALAGSGLGDPQRATHPARRIAGFAVNLAAEAPVPVAAGVALAGLTGWLLLRRGRSGESGR